MMGMLPSMPKPGMPNLKDKAANLKKTAVNLKNNAVKKWESTTMPKEIEKLESSIKSKFELLEKIIALQDENIKLCTLQLNLKVAQKEKETIMKNSDVSTVDPAANQLTEVVNDKARRGDVLADARREALANEGRKTEERLLRPVTKKLLKPVNDRISNIEKQMKTIQEKSDHRISNIQTIGVPTMQHMVPTDLPDVRNNENLLGLFTDMLKNRKYGVNMN